MRRVTAAIALLVLAGCSESLTAPTDPWSGEWTLSVVDTDCWDAFTVDFTVQWEDADNGPAGTVSEWSSPGGAARLIGNIEPDTGFFLRFFPINGGRGADFAGYELSPERMQGQFRDPEGAITEGGACSADAEAVHRV